MPKKEKTQPAFYDIGGHNPAAKQIDDGMKAAGHLFNMMDAMQKLQMKTAKEFEKYASTHEAKISKIVEYDPVKQVMLEQIKIARCAAAHHRAIAAEINEKCSQPAKTWKEDTWKKSFFGPSNAQKEQTKKFKQAQDSWEKMYKKNVQLRDQFYKAAKLENDLQTKSADLQAKDQHYRTSSQELVDEKDNYVRRMNEAFEAAMEFEKQRLQKTSELIGNFNEALGLEKNENMVFELKAKEKGAESEKFNVIDTLESVAESAQSIDITQNLQIYNNTMGPNNAVNMVWPEYQPYDELAQAQKLSGSSASGNVAAGTEGVYNQSAQYDSPPPQKSPSYDSEPESEPEPQVQIADTGGEYTAMVKHPWTKQDDDELELTEGEMIYVLGEPDEEGWCKGRKQDGTEGLFPADYVDMGEAAA
ncbi:Oidioi.mRNA.OKI2018_I69.XSR.g15105.t2.cds [Oikopleura dioica]|uniref:Oidioi.mRNA.OKI2018_I69.XSR.g15105.t2.cds n=1 Tax=Oikopleura dioica TaxID=34765 RepID=A0ABN7SFW6_OIKDI|nr:Oidioi.mRNA.OKI2018_I69.XSR.g15105.t2.cds [Oikopleura dioica]